MNQLHRKGVLLLISVGLSLASCQTPSSIPASSNSTAITQNDCERSGEFAFVPEGEFYFGSTPTEVDKAYEISAIAAASAPNQVPAVKQRLEQQRWFAGEPVQQKLTLTAICVQRNLVTNADYDAFIKATRHRIPYISPEDYQTQGFLVHPYTTVQQYLWQNGTYPEGQGDHPVVLVSYEDAIAYAQWKGQQDQAQYRLPTHQEWEKSARGNDTRYFPWGNEWDPDATNAGHRSELGTTPIGSFPKSRSTWGVEDMSGNVFEYTSTLKPRGSQTVSTMKGCSWDDLPGFCRAAYQHTRPIESRHILFGFRLVKTAQQTLQ